MSNQTSEQINQALLNLRELRREGKLAPGPISVSRGCMFLERPDGTWHLVGNVGKRSKPPLGNER